MIVAIVAAAVEVVSAIVVIVVVAVVFAIVMKMVFDRMMRIPNQPKHLVVGRMSKQHPFVSNPVINLLKMKFR